MVFKCCPNVLHHVASQILMVLINFKGYFQGQKGPIWTFVIYLGQYLRHGACYDHCLYEAHIHSHILWYFSLPCDLWPWITFKGQIKVTPFKGLCLITGALYSESLYEIHIVSHIWPFSLPYNIWPLMKLKGQINVIGCSAGYVS